MCGLVAKFSARATELSTEGVSLALDRMRRRGPDGQDLWTEPGVILGHCRLSVLDLDMRAAQPMHSACGRYVIVFNGEIYNFAQLKRLRISVGDVFHTTSDTEVLLKLFAAEGEAMLFRLRGMFSFVIWDRIARRAFVARDPYGIKPLYFALTNDGILLASQVRALLSTREVSLEHDLHGQAGFWLLGSVPEPRTWFRDIRALPAGHCAWIEGGRIVATRSYWDIGDAWRNSPTHPSVSNDAVQEVVRSALKRSVVDHLVSDVPVGVFLSGGVDSGALAGLMTDAGARDLQGVTIAYDEFMNGPQDEAPLAQKVAATYGMRHHVRRVGREEFLSDLPRIIGAMDQPSIDGINTWYATKAVAELGVKVVLSGVGGDELFQGYESFDHLPRLVSLSSTLMRIPGVSMATQIAGALQARRSGNRRWRHVAEWSRTLPGAWWLRRSLYAPEDLPALMGLEEAMEALDGFDAEAWTLGMSGPIPANPRLALGQIESKAYLRNQLLRDSDWASMDHGVELRTPLVDAWLLADVGAVMPAFQRFPKKSLLASSPSIALPRIITDRPKTGFGIPIGRWLSERNGVSGANVDSRRWAMEVAEAYKG